MPTPRKYPEELRARAQRTVAEAINEGPSLSLNVAVKRIGPRVAVVPDTLRGWIKTGRCRRGPSTGHEHRGGCEVRDLKAEVHELKQANEILLAASWRVQLCRVGVARS